MALIKQEDVINSLVPRASDLSPEIKEETTDPVSFSEGFGVGIRDINTVGSVLTGTFLTTEPKEINTDFDVTPYLEGYEDHANSFVWAKNKDEAISLQSAIDRERADEERLSDAGFAGTLGYITAGLADPINLIPGSKAINTVRFAQRVGSAAAGTARNFGIAETFAEGVRQASQFERSAEESAIAIASVGIAGAVLGGAAGALTKGAKATMDADITTTLKGSDTQIEITEKGVFARTEGTELTKPGKYAIKMNQPILRNPSAKAAISESETFRVAGEAFFESNFIYKKTLSGEGTQAAETFSKLDDVQTNLTIKSVRNQYLSALGVDPDSALAGTKGLFKAKTKDDAPFRSFDDFSSRVHKRITTGTKDPIPQVNAAAEELQSSIFQKWGQELQKAGVLDEGIDTSVASRYFSTVYKREAIVGDRANFEKLIADDLAKQPGNGGKATSKLLADASKITDNIIGIGDDKLQLASLAEQLGKSKGKFTKERTLDFISGNPKYDAYIDQDIIGISSAYARQASTIVRFQEALNRQGFENVGDMLKGIREDHKKLIDAAKTPEEKVKLQKNLDRDLKDAQDMVDLVLGTFGRESRYDTGLEILKVYQVSRLLGGVTLASVPDAGMHILKNGPLRTIVDGIAPMIRNFKAAKLAGDDLQDFALANELEAADVIKNVMNPDFKHGRKQTSALKAADTLQSTLGRVFLISYWNNSHKRMAGRVAEARLMRSFDKQATGVELSKAEIRYLGESGIAPDMAKRIHSQFSEYGAKQDGSYIANFRLWKDQEAATAFAAAIRKHTDSTILTPGKGDIPAIAQGSKLGQVIFQFKSFTATASNKIFVPSIQKHDADTLMGIMSLLTLGAGIDYFREGPLKGRDYKVSLDRALEAGFSRSGVLGLMGDGLFTVGSKLGLMDNARQTRFGDRSLSGFIGGPSAFLLEDAGDLAARATSEGFDERTMRQMSKFLPYQNLFYLRMLMLQLEEGK